MKSTKLASNDNERKRLRGKCIELLSKAEDIKKASEWAPKLQKQVNLKVPRSERAISKREEILLLEGSRLHGFIFPPWTTDPADSVFDEMINGTQYYTWVFCYSTFRINTNIARDATDLELSDAQREIFAGWRRPHENFTGSSELDEELLMAPVDGFDLVQDITTDCSVVASLCAGTARASKGHGTVSFE